MDQKYLLLKDVENLGRSGDIVSTKPGFARNFLLPKKLAVIANNQAIKMQQRLQDERLKKAEADLKDSEQIKSKLESQIFETAVKLDPEGNMYGSVTTSDIAKLIEDNAKISIDKRSMVLKHPIKKTGEHTIQIRLNEGVIANININVTAEEESVR